MVSKRIIFYHLLVLIVLIGCAFLNAVHSSFKMDDHDFFKDPKITNSKFFKYNWVPEPNKFLKLSIASEESSYRPVTNSVLSMLYHRFGLHVQAYHGVSLFAYILGCVLLYVFVLLLSGNGLLAFLTSALFALHPVNGLAVNYVVAAAYAYQLVFTMASMIFFVLSFKWKDQWGCLVLSIIFFVTALGVHETSLILPVYLLGIACLLGRGDLRQGALKAVPFFVVLFVFLVFRMKYASLKAGVLEKFGDFHMSLIEYSATFIKLAAWYFSQLILPDGIVLMWSSKIVHDQTWGWLGAGLAVAGLVIYFIKKWGWSIQSWACLALWTGFGPILVACLFRPATGLVMEPHWMFIPAVGFFMLYAFVLVRIFEWRKWVGVLCIVLLFSGYIKLAHLYNDLWRDEKVYCYYWLQKVPEFKTTEFFLAYAFMQEKNYDQARVLLLNAREGIFSDWQIYSNLGVMDYEQGNLKLAQENYIEALRFNPRSGETFNNLALVFEKNGQIQQAVDANHQALKLNRFLIEPRLNLARISLMKNDVNSAIQLYKDNLGMVPYDHRTTQLLFTALMDAGLLDQAESVIKDLIQHAQSAALLTDIAVLATQKKQLLWAMDLYMQALRIDPDYQDTYIKAGLLLANLDHLDRAIEMWERALKLGGNQRDVMALIAKAKINQDKLIGHSNP